MASIRQNYISRLLKRIVLFFSLAVALLGFLAIRGVQSTQASSARVTDTQLVQATEHFVDQLAAEDKFSGALLIANQNEPIFKKAYGLASKGYNVPNQIDTKFNLGSMNKMFTSVAIAQLASLGKLSFEDTISKLLPGYPNQQIAKKVTVHHLLTHTSGMGSYFGGVVDELIDVLYR